MTGLEPSDFAFYLLAMNPFGGLLLALPLALLKLDYSVWRALGLGLPLAFVQVLVVALGWSRLVAWPRWQRFVEARRSPRLERLVATRGAFWATVIFSPLLGPWLVTAFFQYANVPLRRAALPLFLGLCWNGGAIAAVCVLAPELMRAWGKGG